MRRIDGGMSVANRGTWLDFTNKNSPRRDRVTPTVTIRTNVVIGVRPDVLRACRAWLGANFGGNRTAQQ